MKRAFLLPDLGEGLEDAEVVQWLVAVGDEVTVDQPLVEVETAKANVEIPSPFAGTVTMLHAQPGDTVEVGAPLVTVSVSGDDDAARSDRPTEEAVVAAPAVAPERPLVGFGAAPASASRRAAANEAGAAAGSPRRGGQLATPPVRKRARELGIDLAAVAGTGPDGAVTTRDLDAFVNEGVPEPARPAAQAETDVSRRVALRGVRGRVAEKVTTSRREIPDASTWVDCDATDLVAQCDSMSEGQSDVQVTPLALVLRACVAGLGRFPALNARLDLAAGEIELLGPIHLGFAAQTDRGLVVPVIRDAQVRSTLEIAGELRRLSAAARDGSISPTELVGSTFTVSNYGSFGVDGGVAIINHPEVAILGMGRIVDKAWVVDGAVSVRSVVQLSLSFDHRVMDGAEAGRFLRFVADCVESPAAFLAAL